MYRPARANSLALFTALRELIVLSFILPVFAACTPDRLAPIPFSTVPSIWANSGTPAQPQVVLFRGAFETTSPFQHTELQVFADTRYEVWVDGQWIGRGPARFLKTWREYDVYQLGVLQSGEHLIAVLVQWAPNIRRSESVAPLLKAQVQGQARAGVQQLTATSPKWRCRVMDAWRPDSAPVDTRGLIGPTELLDLRRLPPDWMQLTFQEAGWAHAMEQETSFSIGGQAATIEYSPRSIPHLVDVPIDARVLDAGLLSPGLSMGEIPPSAPSPYSLSFVATEFTNFTIETLVQTASYSETITLDNSKLTWQAAGDQRPNVLVATLQIVPGSHRLDFALVPPQGITFGVSRQGIDFAGLPFQQGVHAGRRLLLAEPVSNQSQVLLDTTPGGLQIELPALPAYVILDLGRTVHGRLVAEAAGQAGSILDIGWDERLRSEANRPLPFPGTRYPEWNQVDSWTLDGTERRISTLDTRSGRYILIAGWGNAPVRLQNVRIEEERYPLTSIGNFESSDPLLNQIWQVGADTLLPNMTDAYTDTPWRERGGWWGDVYVENRVNRVVFGDLALIQRGITTMAHTLQYEPSPGLVPNNNGLHMLDYTMLWVHSLAEYVQQTQDLSLADSAFPELSQFMGHLASYENPQTGLLDLPKGEWSQTAYVETVGLDSRYGQSTALNALYYDTLLRAADLASQAGHTSVAAQWREKAGRIKNGVNHHLYLPSQHRYVSTVFEGAPVEPSPHAQAWPLAYGLVPESEISPVATSLLDLISANPDSANIQIYGMFWVLEALGQANYIPQALEIIRQYYGHLLAGGATTWWETFSSDRQEDNSFSHGWGGSPTWFLSTYVLGARLSGQSWIVKPYFDGLDYASGSLPVQKGVLQVHWERLADGSTLLKVNAQDISGGQVILPLSKPDLVVVQDGQVVWSEGSPGRETVTLNAGEITITVSSGGHEFQIR